MTLERAELLYQDETPGRTVSRALARDKLRSIEAQIAELEQARAVVEWGLRCTCLRLDDCSCDVDASVDAAKGGGHSP